MTRTYCPTASFNQNYLYSFLQTNCWTLKTVKRIAQIKNLNQLPNQHQWKSVESDHTKFDLPSRIWSELPSGSSQGHKPWSEHWRAKGRVSKNISEKCAHPRTASPKLCIAPGNRIQLWNRKGLASICHNQNCMSILHHLTFWFYILVPLLNVTKTWSNLASVVALNQCVLVLAYASFTCSYLLMFTIVYLHYIILHSEIMLFHHTGSLQVKWWVQVSAPVESIELCLSSSFQGVEEADELQRWALLAH